MAVALLIGLWVADEFSYDRWLPDAADVYAIKNTRLENGNTGIDQSTPAPLASAITKDIPGVKYAVTSDWMDQHSLVVGEKRLYTGGGIVSSDFLNVFRYPLISGQAGNVLQEPDAIVLSSKVAAALFGATDPVGQVIRFDNTRNLKVSGVMADVPKNSSLQFSFLVPMMASAKLNWRDNSYQTFHVFQPSLGFLSGWMIFDLEIDKFVVSQLNVLPFINVTLVVVYFQATAIL